MNFSVYFDESGSHGEAQTFSMAGLLGNSSQWEEFNETLNKLKKDFGFTLFHMKEFKAKKGEFKDWSDEKSRELLDSLFVLFTRSIAEGISISIDKAEFEQKYRNAEQHPKMRLDSLYGFAFRSCLVRAVYAVVAIAEKPILNVFLESGHKNAGDAVRIFSEIKEMLAKRGRNILGEIAVIAKQDADPLMVADFLAHLQYLQSCKEQPGDLPMEAAKSKMDEYQSSGWCRIVLDEASWMGVRKSFEREMARNMDRWRKARKERSH